MEAGSDLKEGGAAPSNSKCPQYLLGANATDAFIILKGKVLELD